MKKRILYGLAAPVMAAVTAIIVSSIALLLSGYKPMTAFKSMASYVWSVDSLVNIINRGVPYYVAGCAVAIGFKMGLFNIGADGQYRLAALIAAAAGAAIVLPAPLQIAFILVVAMAVGGAWAGIAGVLKVTRGVNEVVSTIMLNFIATGFGAWLLFEHLRDTSGQNSLVAQTKLLPESAWIPPLNNALSKIGIDLPEGTVLYGFLPYAVVIGILFYLIVYRTRFGFELRTSGVNPSAALSSGVNPKAMVVKTIVLSGAVAGLAGMSPLLCEFHRYGDQFPTAIGFTGISVALLGRNHPAGIALGAFVWAGIERAGQNLSSVGIPQEIGKIIQGTLLLSAVIAFAVVERYAAAQAVREAAQKAAAAHLDDEATVVAAR